MLKTSPGERLNPTASDNTLKYKTRDLEECSQNSREVWVAAESRANRLFGAESLGAESTDSFGAGCRPAPWELMTLVEAV